MRKLCGSKTMAVILSAGILAGIFTGCGSAASGTQTSQSASASEAAPSSAAVSSAASAAVSSAASAAASTTQASASAASATAASSTGKKTTVYAATGGDPKPYVYTDENNQLTGQNIDLLKAIFTKLPQYDLQIEKTDFASVFAGIDSGRYQIGVNNFAKTKERQEKYLFTDPLYKDRYVAVFSPKYSSIKSLDDFTKLSGLNYIGNTAINATVALEDYNKDNPKKQIKINYTDEDVLLQLQDVQSGKYDFMIIDQPMFNSYTAEYKLKLTAVDFSDKAENSITVAPYGYFLVGKGNDQLVTDINSAFKQVVTDGTAKTISVKFFGEDYTPATSK